MNHKSNIVLRHLDLIESILTILFKSRWEYYTEYSYAKHQISCKLIFIELWGITFLRYNISQRGYAILQGDTKYCKGTQNIARGYKKLQGDTKYCKPPCKILYPHTLFEGYTISRYTGLVEDITSFQFPSLLTVLMQNFHTLWLWVNKHFDKSGRPNSFFGIQCKLVPCSNWAFTPWIQILWLLLCPWLANYCHEVMTHYFSSHFFLPCDWQQFTRRYSLLHTFCVIVGSWAPLVLTCWNLKKETSVWMEILIETYRSGYLPSCTLQKLFYHCTKTLWCWHFVPIHLCVNLIYISDK